MLMELSHVAKSYSLAPGVTVDVLRDVSLQLEEASSLAIVGPSGSGKSTLLNLMGALDRPSAGSVKLDGVNVASLSEKDTAVLRNRQIGFVFQMHHLLGQCTALENVLLPVLANGRADAACCGRACELLDRVGLADRMNHRPAQLSVGQCQRVALARALINRPRLLLADEPTGSLDHDSALGLADLLCSLNREEGLAVVVVTHWQELAGRLGRVLTLRDGTLGGGEAS